MVPFSTSRRRPIARVTSAQELSVPTNAESGLETSLETIISELYTRSSQQINSLGLVFVRAPRADDEPPVVPCMDVNDLRLSLLALSPGCPENETIAAYEEWLLSAKRLVQSRVPPLGPTDTIMENLENEFRRLQLQKVSEWERQRGVSMCKERIATLRSSTTLKPDRCAVIDTSEGVFLVCLLPFSQHSKRRSSPVTPFP